MKPNVLIEGQGLEPPAHNELCEVTRDLARLVKTGRKFACLYADPPWRYGKQAGRAAVGKRYRTMSLEEIAALPVPELSAEQSHLYLWATNSFLFEALLLLKGWGFAFENTFVWCKPQLGCGNYFRVSHEVLLLGVRGGLPFPPGIAVRGWVIADRTEHSEKPEVVRSIIEQVSPGPRLELFARKRSPGWTVFGDQISQSLLDPVTRFI